MRIRTEQHHIPLTQSTWYYISGERPHAYRKWVFEGLIPRRRAFRCRGQRAPEPDSFLRPEDLILREVRAIRKMLEAQHDS